MLSARMAKENTTPKKEDKDDIIVLDEKGEEFDLGKDELDVGADDDEDDSDDYDFESGGDD